MKQYHPIRRQQPIYTLHILQNILQLIDFRRYKLNIETLYDSRNFQMDLNDSYTYVLG